MVRAAAVEHDVLDVHRQPVGCQFGRRQVLMTEVVPLQGQAPSQLEYHDRREGQEKVPDGTDDERPVEPARHRIHGVSP